MKRAKWPRECPVFEFEYCTCEGVGVEPGKVFLRWIQFGEGRCFDVRWSEWPWLKPLTPTARAMLAIAKQGAK